MYFMSNKMKKNKLFGERARGFTLIEVIVALVVAAILGTMLVTFMSTGITQSVRQVFSVKNTYDIGKVMENITAHYKTMFSPGSSITLATLKINVGAAGSTVTNAYGSYKVINNDYKIFNCTGSPSTCAESNGGSSTLKVTIADQANTQTITALFAQ
jgi:prepilin-type N-terminal cleavage/methylation domain-containing protein